MKTKILGILILIVLGVTSVYAAGHAPKGAQGMVSTMRAMLATDTPVAPPTSTPQPTEVCLYPEIGCGPTLTAPAESEQRAPRVGYPVGGYGPIIATPAGTLGPWAWATPCNGWIDANGVIYCVTATATFTGSETPTATQYYPAGTPTPQAYPIP